jgi:tRNA pseudouridine55 synthase
LKWLQRLVPGNSIPFGFINANKPAGITSTAFGSRVRRALGRVPLGHWGTLDPDATGVLVLAVGHATKLLPLLGDGRKKYEFDLVLGSATDTGDASGATIASSGMPDSWHLKLPDVVRSVIGELSQIPPMYSAVKIAGQPLYKSARRGEEVTRQARAVEIYSLRMLEHSHSRARLALECSAGTYVRTLCEEIGSRLGVPAHMDALVRTAAGPFNLAAACALELLLADPSAHLIDPLNVLQQVRVALSTAHLTRFAHGNAVLIGGESSIGEVLVTCDGQMVGTGIVAAATGGALLQPARVFS